MKLLFPLALLYSFVMFLRNKAFDWGLLKTESAGVPVISIGNITVGGTGKTPLTEYILKELIAGGKRVGVVSRGYGRASQDVVVVSDGRSLLADARTGGDEPVQIAMKFPEAIVVVAGKRVEAARIAVRLGAQVLLMDDGFQHRYLKRDLDIVVVDASSVTFPDRVLPAGFARESWKGLRRSDLVAFSNIEEGEVGAWREKIGHWYQGPCSGICFTMTALRKAKDNSDISAEILRDEPAVAFSGIGNHLNFTKTLRSSGLSVVGDVVFPDHHTYSHDDLTKIESLKNRVGARVCITTEKDVVRLGGDPVLQNEFMQSLNLHYVKVAVKFAEGEHLLNEYMEKVVG